MPQHAACRNRLCLATLVGALMYLPAFADANPVCSPAPAPINWTGGGTVYLDRDIESCRVFSEQRFYDPKIGNLSSWHENTPAEIQHLIDLGNRVAFNDRPLAGSTIQVIEYLNTELGRYFLAIPEESGAIERGEAGHGWVRTGYGFTARTTGASPLSVPVVRFYGSMSPGPNSHFFTIDPQEYSALQREVYVIPPYLPHWNSDGVPFNAFPVIYGGTCAAARIPVWRVFNGGPQRGVESNHRFSTDKSVIDDMVSQGWIAEGIAFCVDADP